MVRKYIRGYHLSITFQLQFRLLRARLRSVLRHQPLRRLPYVSGSHSTGVMLINFYQYLPLNIYHTIFNVKNDNVKLARSKFSDVAKSVNDVVKWCFFMGQVLFSLPRMLKHLRYRGNRIPINFLLWHLYELGN